jgi:hypothetical protein
MRTTAGTGWFVRSGLHSELMGAYHVEAIVGSAVSSFEIGHPASSEYAPFYAGYVARVTDDPLVALEGQGRATQGLLGALSEAQAGHRYADGKWTVRDVVGHLVDTERVMSYRALRIARGDATPLEGFEQDDYVLAAHADRRKLNALLSELAAVRASSVTLFRGIEEEAWRRVGTANGVPVSARALAHIIVGHERHHVEILRTRYGIGSS